MAGRGRGFTCFEQTPMKKLEQFQIASTDECRLLDGEPKPPGQRSCPFHDPSGARPRDRRREMVAADRRQLSRPGVEGGHTRGAGEIGGPALASRRGQGKKAELAQAAERICAGDFTGEVEVKERALAWLPDPLRFAVALTAAMGGGGQERYASRSSGPRCCRSGRGRGIRRHPLSGMKVTGPKRAEENQGFALI